MRVIIDGRFVLGEADLHRRLAGSLGYGPCYEPSLEALGRRLSMGDPRPLLLTWIHAPAMRLALGTARYLDFVRTLRRVEDQDEGEPWSARFVFRIFD